MPKDRLLWIDDDESGSVKSLAKAMGVAGQPKYVVALFPERLEKVLRKLEQSRYNGAENNIDETVFRIEKKNEHFEPVVQSVKLKNGSDTKNAGKVADPGKVKP